MSRIQHLLSCACVAALLGAANPAAAQTAGTYTGVNSQGKPVEVKLVDDGVGGLILESLVMFWTADCTRSGPGREVAWGVGSNTAVTSSTVDVEFRGNGLYEKWRLVFDGGSVSGTFTGRTPEFTDIETSTRSVQRCDSGNLTFSASQSTPAILPLRLPAGAAVQLR